MKKLLPLAFFFSVFTAEAQFSGAFAPSNWTFSSTTIGGDGSVVTTNAPTSITLHGADIGSGSTVPSPYEDYAITIPSTGEISFSYNHVNNDIDDAYYTINGVEYFITYSGIGTISNIIIPPNATFSFRVKNYDFCCGRGSLTISNFVFVPYPTCSGTPATGTTVSTQTNVCPLENYTVSLSGLPSLNGITFQWQSALSSTGPWTNIAGANLSSTQASQTVNTWYRCAVTCATSNITDYSNAIEINTLSSHPAGTYTIGPGGDFQDFSAATNAIKYGIDGPIVFNVLPNSGPYVEQISIPHLANSSSTNTVTFNCFGNTISFAPSATLRHILKLDGADYITFNDLNIVSTGTANTFAVIITNDANYNTFSNCTIDLTSTFTSTASTNAGIIISGSTTSATGLGVSGSHNIIRNSKVIGGYYSLTMMGASASNNITSNQVLNCVFEDFYYYGVYAGHLSNSIVKGNTFKRPNRTNVSQFRCYFLTSSGINNVFDSNRMYQGFGGVAITNTGTSYPIYHNGVDATLGNENMVTNNIMQLNGNNGAIYAIYNSSSDHVHYLHNTISIDDANSTAGLARGFHQVTTATGIVFRNNIISMSRGGSGTKYLYYLSTAGSTISINNNILNLTAPAGTNYFGYYSTNQAAFANWQAANSAAYDQNSQVINPMFGPLPNLLMPTNMAMNNLGFPVSVNKDLVGLTRSTTTPDIGAYEMNTVVTDVEISNLTTISAPCYSASDTVIFTITNTMATALDLAVNNLVVDWEITGAITASGTETYSNGTIAPLGNLSLNLIEGINLSTVGSYTITANVSSSWDHVGINNTVQSRFLTPPLSTPQIVSQPVSITPCVNTSTSLEVVASYPGTISYEWYNHGVLVPGANGPIMTFNNITVADTGAYTVKVFGTCYFVESDTAILMVDPLVVEHPLAQSVCEGEDLHLNVLVLGTGNISYDWKFDGVSLGLPASSPNLEINNIVMAQGEQYSVSITSTTCGTISSDPAIVTVLPLPVVIANATALSVCTGDMMVLFGSGSSNYSWSNGVQDNMPFVPVVTDSYTVSVTDNNGCVGTDEITIVVNPLPNVVANASINPACVGDQVTIFGSGASVYSWSGGIIDNETITANSNVTYTVTGIDNNNCSNEASLELIVNPLPNNVKLSVFNTACVNHKPFDLVGGSPQGGEYFYQSTQLQQFDPSVGAGNHEITYIYTDGNGCKNSASSMLVVDACLSIENLNAVAGSVRVYPNPAFNTFVVEFSSGIKEKVELHLMNSTGQVVLKERREILTGVNKLQIECNDMARGIYYLNVIGQDQSIRNKIILK